MLNGTENFREFPIESLEGCGFENDGKTLAAFDEEIHPGFGRYIGAMGMLEPSNLPVAVDEFDNLGGGIVRTPMMELAPYDYKYVEKMGVPYDGMKAVSDMGDLYEWSTMDGLFSRIKRGFRKVRKKIRRGRRKLRKIMAKTKFGRVLIKIGGKIKKIALKVVLPLAKVVGKWAPRLAPIAALIPGVGPIISGAMLAAGTAGKLIDKYGSKIKQVISVSQKTGKKRIGYKLTGLTKKNKRKLQRDLRKEASRFKKMPQKKLRALTQSLKNKPPELHSRVVRPSKKARAAAERLSKLARIERTRDRLVAQRRRMLANQAKAKRAAAARRKKIVQLSKILAARKAAIKRSSIAAKKRAANRAVRRAVPRANAAVRAQQINAYLAAARALGWRG